jgi:hypothetical protein
LGLFLTDHDVEAFQNALVVAADQYGP